MKNLEDVMFSKTLVTESWTGGQLVKVDIAPEIRTTKARLLTRNTFVVERSLPTASQPQMSEGRRGKD